MAEASLSESADRMEMVGVEDVFGLDLEVAFEHGLSSLKNKINLVKI